MRNNIERKVVVITGASSGLGEATARLLSTEGASIVLGARREDRLQALVSELTARGSKATALTTDVTHRDQVQKLVDIAVQTYGRIDVIINNAGLMPQSLLEQLKVDEWDRMIDVNIKGVLYGIAAALPYMQKQKAGHIINVSSVAGHKVGPGSYKGLIGATPESRCFVSGRACSVLRDDEALRIQELLEGANIFARVPELAILSERDCVNARVRESGQ